jgi:iron only hydrogenase large subunit-like protein
MKNTKDIINLIENNKSIALLAPAFPIDFKYPDIIGMLRHLGFDKVTELTFGARMVNWAYAQYIKEHPKQKLFIASPCPTVVAFIQAQYPDFVKYLIPIVSPMASMAKIYKQNNEDYKVIFISPCFAKENIEAPKYKEFIDAVITFEELQEIFDAEGIDEKDFNRKYYFDSLIREYTKIYPISGGLATTSHIGGLFKKDEILITDGIENIKKALEQIKSGEKKYRFLDILNCQGGCIGGPAINNKDLSIERKKEIIRNYAEESSKQNMGEHHGKVEQADGIDFSANF